MVNQQETPTTITTSLDTEKEPVKVGTNDRGILFLSFMNYVMMGSMMFYCYTLELILIEAGYDPGDLGLLSIQVYPFTFKFIMAPFLDAYHFRFLGRRKTYVVIFLVLFGLLQIVMGTNLKSMIQEGQLTLIVAGGFTSIFFLAIHGLGIDTWTLSSIDPSNYPVASAIKQIGNLCGYYVSVHLLIVLGKIEFGGFRLIQPDTFLVFLGFVAIGIAVMSLLFKAEPPFNNEKTVNPCFVLSHLKVLFTKWNHILLFTFLLLSYVGFGPAEFGKNYFLIGQKKMPKEDFMTIDAILFPLKFVAAIFIGNYLKKRSVIGTMLFSYAMRFIYNVFLIFAVRSYDPHSPQLTNIFIVSSSFFFVLCDTAFAVSVMAFYNKITDPLFGATHISALYSASNAGKSYAKTGTMYLFTVFQYETVCLGGWIFGAVFLVVFTRILFYLDSLPQAKWRLTEPKEDQLLEADQTQV